MKNPVNLQEVLVKKVVDEQLINRADACSCDKCKADILAIALNNLRPRYVVTDKGRILAKTAVLDNQINTDILVEVSKAIEIVSKNPRHD